MPKDKIAVDKLIEGMEFENDAEREAVVKALSRDKNLDLSSERYMLRADYSRQSDALSKEKTEAERKAKEADVFKQTLMEWEREQKPKFEYLEYLESLGIEPKVGVVPDVNKPPTPPPAIDRAALTKELSGHFVSVEAAAPFLRFQAQLQPTLIDLQSKHQALFGKAPEAMRPMVDEFMAGVGEGKYQFDINTFEQYAAERFHFADREKELADKSLEDRAQKMADEKYAAMVSTQGFPAPTGDAPQSVLLEDTFRTAQGRADLNQAPNNATLAQFAQANAELERAGVKLYQ